MKLGDILGMPPSGDSELSPKDLECSKARTPNQSIEEELAKRLLEVVEWLDDLFPELRVRVETPEKDLPARLLDGGVFCRILKRFKLPSSEEISSGTCDSVEKRLDYIRSFVSAVEQMGLPGFKVSDLEEGQIAAVVYCLWSLKDHLNSISVEEKDANSPVKSIGQERGRPKPLETRRSKVLEFLREDINQTGHNSVDWRLNNMVTSPLSVPSPRSHRSGLKFHEIFQTKQGRISELPAAKISELLRSNSLDNAPTQSLLSVIHGILEESIENENGENPHSIAFLLKRVVQQIERRISTQAEHIRTQNNLIKIREDKYECRIRELQNLTNASKEEVQTIAKQLQQLEEEKSNIEEKKKYSEEDLVRLVKEKENCEKIISELMENIENMKRSYEEQLLQQETRVGDSQIELKRRLNETESLLLESNEIKNKIAADSESRKKIWNKKEEKFKSFIDLHLRSVQGFKLSFHSIKHEVMDIENRRFEEFSNLGGKLKVLTDTAENYNSVLAENRKLYNEVQELKGNIRVHCRIRPFLSGENKKQTIIEHIGDNGELLLGNPSKQGKDGQRMFTFNSVYGPSASQEEVFLDTRPLIRSVLDGYNVCIFAYGQTGSGKTYTMTGPDGATEKDWGVNYRALRDLFQISHSRREMFSYEVGVQMVEIYNEQVRDLLANHGSQKRLGVMTTSKLNGLPVPDASMHPVNSTSDVLELMKIGQTNRAVGATALNERSSRSHSILTVHVRAMELKTGAILRGSLHLVDLAGSERVDRAEVVGDRLKEAQHINKSLASLGDVIFALSQKSSHVPYRNSKLTQILQSSLGGHAKTLMFVQINPDGGSYSETLSTLKFAERVSGIELGAAKSQKEGKDVRELMEQVTSLKNTIARKDEEIEQLKQQKVYRKTPLGIKMENFSNIPSSPLKHNPSSSTGISTTGGMVQRKQRLLSGKLLNNKRASKKHENCPKTGYHSESSSQKSSEDNKSQKEIFTLQTSGSTDHSLDVELLCIGDGDEGHLSDISDGPLSMGTETDTLGGSPIEFSLFPEFNKQSETSKEKQNRFPTRTLEPTQKKTEQKTKNQPKSKDASSSPMSGSRKSANQLMTVSQSKPQKRWQ